MLAEQIERYKRHLLVKEIGGSGQKKLLDSRITIVGAGALGGQMALMLAASGVGTLQVFDDDLVEVSNLHRQTHFSSHDIGVKKVEALKARIQAVNPDIELNIFDQRWSPEMSDPNARLLLDGTDNFETRFAMNAWSRAKTIPFLTGAVGGWQGQAMLVNAPSDTKSPCYKCLVPEKPTRAGDCNDIGTLGMITALTASHMSLIAMKYLLDLPVRYGELWLMDGLGGQTRTVRLPQDPGCPVCKHD